MSKSYLIISLGLFLMVLGGCQDSKKAEQPTNNQPPPTKPNTEQKTQNFDNPTTKGQPTVVVSSALTPSTNPDQRFKSISKGSSIANRNPFEVIIPTVNLPPLGKSPDGSIVPLPQSKPPVTVITNLDKKKPTTGKTERESLIQISRNLSKSNSRDKTTNIKVKTAKVKTAKVKTTRVNTAQVNTAKVNTAKVNAAKINTVKVKTVKPDIKRNKVIKEETTIATRTSLNQTPPPNPSLPSSIPVPPPPKETTIGAIPNQLPGQLRGKGSTIPQVEPDFTFKSPPKPEPDQARQVVITGIIEINGINYAIAQSPGDRDSRYVKQGDLLANGQVLVKGIEGNEVILEQLGQSVSLAVGSNSKTEKTN